MLPFGKFLFTKGMHFFEPRIYTVESVTEGHPDKVCDQISDAILDECLKQDPMARTGIEIFGNHKTLIIGGEVTTNANVDYEAIARQVYKEIGYDNDLDISVRIAQQAPEIAKGVNFGGAGDQGIMYGYATNETKQYLPKGIVLVHALTRRLADLRKSKQIRWLGPDGKAQITICDGEIDRVLVSTQHSADVGQDEVRKTIIEQVIQPVCGNVLDNKILVNPTGSFIQGGFDSDAGLTGRKIMVDTYGGLLPHGGGSFSGKDPTKVDRSAAYMCRYVAKQLVKEGHAKQALVSVAYAIGVADPLMLSVINEKGVQLPLELLKKYDFTPSGIIKTLDLRRPIYRQSAVNGHFTNPSFPWN